MGPGTSLIAPSSTHRNRMGFVGTCKLEGVEKSPRTLGLLLLGGHSANWWRQVPLALPPPHASIISADTGSPLPLPCRQP